jgi:hypothetical protein
MVGEIIPESWATSSGISITAFGRADPKLRLLGGGVDVGRDQLQGLAPRHAVPAGQVELLPLDDRPALRECGCGPLSTDAGA